MKLTSDITDRLFLQEIINDLERNGYVRHGKAHDMLRDWSRELREKTHTQGRTKRLFRENIGIENY